MGIQQQFTNTGEVWTPTLSYQQSLNQPIQPPISLDGIGNSLPDPSAGGGDMMSMLQAMMSMQQPQQPVDIGAQVQQAVAKSSGVKGNLGTQSFNGIQKGNYY